MSSIAERIAGLSEEKRQLLELLRQENRDESSSARKPSLDVDTTVSAQPSQAFCLISDVDRQHLPEDVEDAYPLTMLQAGMLYHMEETPEYPLYHNVDSYNLEGELDHATMQDTMNRVVARHPVLRTSFALKDYSEPLQLVHRTATLPVTIDDLRHLPAPEQDKMVNAYVEKEKRLRFDLAHPPLLRFHIHRRTADTFQFTLTECHPILDGWSLNSTLAEIFTLYFTLLKNQPVPAAPLLSTSFRDYVILERKALESDEFRQYWTQALSDSSMMELPRWPASHRIEGDRPVVGLRVPIAQQLLEDLKQFAQSIAMPLKSVLLAAHMKVMSALGGQDDVITGLATQGRPETAGGAEIRGLFLNIVPYRLNLSDGSWVDLVREAFEVERDLLPYRRYPLASIQKNMGGRPLFETAFNMVRFHIYLDLLESDNKLEMVGTGQELEENNFTLMTNFGMHPSGSHLILVLEYHTSELCEEQVKAISRYYTNTLAAMVSTPHSLHQSFNVLSRDEQEQIIVNWNDTKTDFASTACLQELFEEQAARAPAAVAVVFGSESLTYQQLNERANQLAHHLRALGVGPECVVALLLERSFEMVVSILAVLKAGGAYLPLDPSYPPQRLSFMLSDAQPVVLLTQGDAPSLVHVPKGMAVVVLAEAAEALAQTSTANPGVEVNAANLAYVIYTSGSTGQPKGVMITHGGLSNYLSWSSRAYGVKAGRGVPLHSSLSFDLSITALFNPLITGGWVHLLAEERGVEALSTALLGGAQDYSLVKITPAHLGALRQTVSESGAVAGTRCFVIGGEALSWDEVRYWREQGTERQLVNEYGPTETVVGCCVYEVGEEPERAEAQVGGVPIGRPVANMQMYVLDQGLRCVPVGVSGELYIGGAGLARGYRGRAALTAESFVPHPYSAAAGARLYRTGDIGKYRPDGRLEYEGRRDEQVKVRGYRIELGEIEAALRENEAVSEAVVVVQEDENGHKRLVGYLIGSEGPEASGGELRRHLGERLPEYMVPGQHVWLKQWPLTSNGKVDRRALALMQDADVERGQRYVAARTPSEAKLAGIWEEVLAVKTVGIHDNFFELGGDSIVSLQIIAKAGKAGLLLLPEHIFQYPTVAGLASVATVAAMTSPVSVNVEFEYKDFDKLLAKVEFEV